MQLFLKYAVMTPRSLKRGLTPFGGKLGGKKYLYKCEENIKLARFKLNAQS